MRCKYFLRTVLKVQYLNHPQTDILWKSAVEDRNKLGSGFRAGTRGLSIEFVI
jgi:hypothetical protein